ncbi:hypothetical protein [Wolbachia endosymbiont (group A) of Icerya purchasi]|uniref:hypothetical protein n=1 Tax=Wolbachia endosymbiont (group A) of Icerya purchasi TaxID=2954019 RepID=UPI002231A84E|nr:hypothetical protein [Wolbachia endosymbiont (group A) of Icerya purchasi]
MDNSSQRNYKQPSSKCTTFGDREADIFKFLWVAETLGSFYAIRNRANRRFICTEVGKTDLQTRIIQLPVKKKISLEVTKGGNQRSRKANIEVKYMKAYQIFFHLWVKRYNT